MNCTSISYKCGGACISVGEVCRIAGDAVGEENLKKVGDFAKRMAGAVATVGEVVISQQAGKIIGGAIAGAASQHGIDQQAAKIIAESGVQAITATLLHARKAENRNAKELVTKFVTTAASASIGKMAGSAAHEALSGGDDHVRFVATIAAGSGGGAGTGAAISSVVKKHGETISKLVDRVSGNRHDSDTGKPRLDLSKSEQEALFDLALIGFMLAQKKKGG